MIKVDVRPTAFLHSPKHVYVIQFDNAMVKIGITRSIKHRVGQLVKQFGGKYKITKLFYTEKIYEALDVERTIKECLSKDYQPCYGTECFLVQYEEVLGLMREINLWHFAFFVESQDIIARYFTHTNADNRKEN